MVGRIITARHGMPHMDRSVRITAKEYGTWWANYDLAGLAPGEAPPPSLIQVADECDKVICSTLPRAIETAAMIVGDEVEVPQDAIYVEAPLPPPPVPFLKLTPTNWGRVSRVFWFLGYAPNGIENHLSARARVREVANRLIQYAEEGHTVLLCAHGYLNWMIDGQLRRQRWQRVARDGGNHYWSWRAYRPRGKAAQPVGPAQPAELP